MRTKTYNAGATAERSAIIAKVRRLNRGGLVPEISGLLAWLLLRHARYNRKPRGVGK